MTEAEIKLREANQRVEATRIATLRIAVLEQLHNVFPEFILIYREDMNSSRVLREAKGHELSVIGAIEKVKAQMLWPHLDELA